MLDGELDELTSSLGAIALEGAKAVGKTAVDVPDVADLFDVRRATAGKDVGNLLEVARAQQGRT